MAQVRYVHSAQNPICPFSTPAHWIETMSSQPSRCPWVGFLLFVVLWLLPTDAVAPCTLCADPNSTITLPDKEISVPGFEFISDCGQLDSLVGILLTDDAPLCWTLRNVSSVCGCPLPDLEEGEGCNLCGKEEEEEEEPQQRRVGDPDRPIPHLFQDQFGGFVPTCELLEAYLYNIPESSATCSLSQDILQRYCACPTDNNDPEPVVANDEERNDACSLCRNGENITLPDKLLDVEGFPVQTCGELTVAASVFLQEGDAMCSLMQSVGTFCGCPAPLPESDSCTMCRDGRPVPLPNATFGFLEADFGFRPTCALVEAQLDAVPAGSDQCLDMQRFGSLCGCPPLENECQACPNPPPEFSREILPMSRDALGVDLSCYEISQLLLQTDQRSDICFEMTDRSWLCGCNGGTYSYFGADTVSKKIALVWLPRASGALSIMGSLFIYWDILRSRNKLKSTFHQIILSMSVFDIVSSIAWALTSVPIPEYSPYGFPTGIYGARGTDQTCTAQGFFVQLGVTGALYNLSLSCYYTLAIALGWTETKLRRVRIFLHLPAVIGLALALAGIPYYAQAIWGCYLQPPPIADAFHVSVFFMLPIASVVAIATINMLIVTLAVRRNLRRSRKWRRGGGNKSQDLETQVLWQAAFYLSAFYVSYPLLIATNTREATVSSQYWLYLTATTLAPLQGFSNFLVYVRPRVMRWVHRSRADRKRRLRRSQQTRGSSTDSAISEESLPTTTTTSPSPVYRWLLCGWFLAHTSDAIDEDDDDFELQLASGHYRNVTPQKTDKREDSIELDVDNVQEFADDDDDDDVSVDKEDVINIASSS